MVTKCEICQEENASKICSRCYRLICNKCFNERWNTCIECATVKNVMSEDYVRFLEHLNNVINIVKQKISSSEECLTCPILREYLMSNYARIKQLIPYLSLEGYDKAEIIAQDLKKDIESLLIKILVSKFLQLYKGR